MLSRGRLQQQSSTFNRRYTTLLRKDTINPNILKAEYAVRGRVLIQADKYRRMLQSKESEELPFDEIIYCNIGNPQQLKQSPITFNRNVISLALSPELLDNEKVRDVFPRDVVDRARSIVDHIDGNTGAYTHSQGLDFIREEVASFIQRRDGLSHPVDPSRIFLTDGASPACQLAIRCMIRGEQDGIMVPIPQYPLYSATIALYGGTQVNYYLDEDNAWSMDVANLEEAHKKAREQGIEVRALAVINPGNPTGQVMSKENMKEVIDWCISRQVVLLADEVYQENIYSLKKSWASFKRVSEEMGQNAVENLQLLSFHSVSKGFLGECGRRGGYMEVSQSVPQEVVDEMYKVMSVNLCPNVDGQLMTGLMVNPPQEGDPSYSQYKRERDTIIESLGRRAKKLVSILNSLDGVKCNEAEGAMYAFPQITIPKRAVEHAKKSGLAPDLFYVLSLLDSTGICVVPGSGFGQKSGTYHFRTTFLPPEDQMESVGEKLRDFHTKFMQKWA